MGHHVDFQVDRRRAVPSLGHELELCVPRSASVYFAAASSRSHCGIQQPVQDGHTGGKQTVARSGSSFRFPWNSMDSTECGRAS